MHHHCLRFAFFERCPVSIGNHRNGLRFFFASWGLSGGYPVDPAAAFPDLLQHFGVGAGADVEEADVVVLSVEAAQGELVIALEIMAADAIGVGSYGKSGISPHRSSAAGARILRPLSTAGKSRCPLPVQRKIVKCVCKLFE